MRKTTLDDCLCQQRWDRASGCDSLVGQSSLMAIVASSARFRDCHVSATSRIRSRRRSRRSLFEVLTYPQTLMQCAQWAKVLLFCIRSAHVAKCIWTAGLQHSRVGSRAGWLRALGNPPAPFCHFSGAWTCCSDSPTSYIACQPRDTRSVVRQQTETRTEGDNAKGKVSEWLLCVDTAGRELQPCVRSIISL